MPAVIRPACLSDLAALLPLLREFTEIDQHPYDEAVVGPALTGLLTDDRYGFVLVVADPEPVAYAVVTWSYSLESGGRDCCLDEFYVRDRGRGTGGALLDAALDEARSRGARRVFLETEAHNTRVRGLYARHGFDREDSVWMSRAL